MFPPPEPPNLNSNKGAGAKVSVDYSGTIVDEATRTGDVGNDRYTTKHVGSGAVTVNVIDDTKETVNYTIASNNDYGAVKATEVPASNAQLPVPRRYAKVFNK